MTAKQIYTKTMKFNWMKLGLGLLNILISIVLFAIFAGIGVLIDNGGLMLVMILIWAMLTKVTNFMIMHYFGYLLKAGHVAVISTAVTTGQIPENPVEVGKEMVTSRFATSNIYFGVDKLITGAVRQLQHLVEKTGNMFSFIPGMGMITSFGKIFINISLGYIDECCLGYTFFQKEQGACKSAADGVVIYAQNWKKLLKDAAKTSLVVILAMAALSIGGMIVFVALFKLLGWSILAAVILSIFFASAVKYAFLDSWILVNMMTSYMEVAPTTEITFDLYDKLCGISRSFRKLFQQGQEEQSQPAYATAGATSVVAPVGVSKASATPAMVFCGQCGVQNEVGTKFCGNCGVQV